MVASGSAASAHAHPADVAPRGRISGLGWPFRACREADDVGCVDFKDQFPTLDGRLCYLLTILDVRRAI